MFRVFVGNFYFLTFVENQNDMKNTEKLMQLGKLKAIRKRLGASEDSTEYDNYINEMSAHDIIREWCGWNLGSGAWWDQMKQLFDSLETKDNA